MSKVKKILEILQVIWSFFPLLFIFPVVTGTCAFLTCRGWQFLSAPAFYVALFVAGMVGFFVSGFVEKFLAEDEVSRDFWTVILTIVAVLILAFLVVVLKLPIFGCILLMTIGFSRLIDVGILAYN